MCGTLPDFGNFNLGDGKRIRPLQGRQGDDAFCESRQRQIT
jgi:hypothetical protein